MLGKLSRKVFCQAKIYYFDNNDKNNDNDIKIK